MAAAASTNPRAPLFRENFSISSSSSRRTAPPTISFHDPVLMAKPALTSPAAGSIPRPDDSRLHAAPRSVIDYDLEPRSLAFVAMYDGGKMDGADQIPLGCATDDRSCPPPNPQFCYVKPSDVAALLPVGRAIHVRRSHVSDQPGSEFPGAPVHHFRHLRTHGDQQLALSRKMRAASRMRTGTTGCTAPPAEFVSVIDASRQ